MKSDRQRDLWSRMMTAHRDGRRPRVHGNGFIQLDLDERERVHVWGDRDIPRQRVPTPVHDHLFGFVSTVYVGAIMNTVYRLSDVAPTHAVYEANIRRGEDTVLVRSGVEVRPVVVYAQTYHEGQCYFMDPYVFHETHVDAPAVTTIIKQDKTLAQRGGFGEERPRVLCRLGEEPDNDFRRDAYDERFLWEIIRRVAWRDTSSST